jgi:hypothetical protein
MEYEQDERNKNVDHKNIEYLHKLLTNKFHLNKHEEFLDYVLLMKINYNKKNRISYFTIESMETRSSQVPTSTYPTPDPIGSCKIRPSDKIR